jgi:WD40 repeat protein
MAPARDSIGDWDPFDPSDRIVDMSHDAHGNLLVSAHESNRLKLWRRDASGSWILWIALQSAHESAGVAAVRWAPPALSPSMLATVGADGVLAIYELASLSCAVEHEQGEAQILKIQDAEAELTDVAFSDDGILATLGVEQVVRVYWSQDSGKRWGLQSAVDLFSDVGSGLAFMPGSRRVLCAGRVLLSCGRQMWNYGFHSELQGNEEVVSVSWGRSGYIGLGRRDGGVELWRVSSNGCAKEALLADAVDQTGVAAAQAVCVEKVLWDFSGEVLCSSHSDGSVRVWARCARQSPEGECSWPWSLRDSLPAEIGREHSITSS